eukprot:4908910-Prymnesium_polylepis.2
MYFGTGPSCRMCRRRARPPIPHGLPPAQEMNMKARRTESYVVWTDRRLADPVRYALAAP